jgi:AcrR family transcriptional regulator
MRDKLVKAAVKCLHERGFAATTLANVADAAGVSRGAITHHFPSKAELALTVVRAVHDEDMAWYRTQTAKFEPRELMLQLPKMMWQVLSRPAGIAVMEIFLGARSDPELAERLAIIQSQIRTESAEAMSGPQRAANLAERADREVIQTLITGAVRGLAMEVLITRRFDVAEQAIERLTDVIRFFYPGLNDLANETPATVVQAKKESKSSSDKRRSEGTANR